MMKWFLIIGILVSALCLLVTPAQAGIRVERKSGDLSNGLVGYWTFDGADISGTTALDKSGQGNNGTITGATKKTGKLGQGLKFNGSSDKVLVSYNASLNLPTVITISAWINIKSLATSATIVAKGSNYLLQLNDASLDELTFAFYTGGWREVTTQDLNLQTNTWYHVAVVFDEATNTVYFYANGALNSSPAQTNDMPNADASDLMIGTNSSNEYFNGIIDDVRIYNRALSADEVKRLYNIGKGVSTAASQQNKQTSGLVGYWTFDGPDISGSTAYDRSGQGNNGTINGATRTVGKIGQAMKFGGGGQNISAGTTGVDTTAGHHNTVVFWMNYTGPLGDAVFAFDNGGDYDLWFTDNPCFGFNTHNSEVLGISASGLNNRWVHVAAVFYNGTPSAANNKLYIDGSQQSIYYCRGSSSISRTAGGTLYWASSGGYEFAGKIDEGRVYNRELSADEIKALYNQAGSKFHASQENQLTTGLVGYWPFNGPDISGTTAYDRSGQGNNGTITGAIQAAGKLGQGLSFDGLNAYVTVTGTKTYAAQNSPFSVSAWAYLNSFTNGWPVIVKLRTDTSHPWYLLLSNDTNYLGISVGSGSTWACLKSGTNPDTLTGKWQHFAAVYNGAGAGNAANFSIYSDGQPVSMSASAGYGTYSQGTEIGSETGSGTSNLWQGLIDDVRVYNRALSAEEIKRLYNMGR